VGHAEIDWRREIVRALRNARVLNVLRLGKQLQLWDSNVHCKVTQYGGVLQVLRKWHN
jgi:hypothetical protein